MREEELLHRRGERRIQTVNVSTEEGDDWLLLPEMRKMKLSMCVNFPTVFPYYLLVSQHKLCPIFFLAFSWFPLFLLRKILHPSRFSVFQPRCQCFLPPFIKWSLPVTPQNFSRFSSFFSPLSVFDLLHFIESNL